MDETEAATARATSAEPADPGPSLTARLLRRYVVWRHKVEIYDLQHWYAADKAVVAVNFLAHADPAILAAVLPDDHVIALPKHLAGARFARQAAKLSRVVFIDLEDASTVRQLVRLIDQHKKLVVFPEGRPSKTGQLAKSYGWPAMIADLAGVPILPIRIDGSQYGPSGGLAGTYRPRRRGPVRVTVLPARPIPVPTGLKGAAKRDAMGRALGDVMIEAAFDGHRLDRPLIDVLIDQAEVHGFDRLVLEDQERQPISYRRLLLGAFVLGDKLAALTEPGERVGLLLPNSNGCVVTFFGLHAFGRVPAMLNFSAGPAALKAAVETGPIRVVLTSRRFVEIGKFEASVEAIATRARVVYLEDVRGKIGTLDKIKGLVRSRRPRATVDQLTPGRKGLDPAVVLFTSGSEGVPKGVVLSHRAINANRLQIEAIADFSPAELIFNALPVFHSFGLTAALMMPLLGGMRVFLYPSPLHYKIIPDLVYDSGATILFGTDTFLSGFARNSHPYDFRALIAVVAGGEKVKPETKQLWTDKHGIRLMEGYGVTECAPVLACNTPNHSRAGSVGRLLPRVEACIDPVPGIDRGGRLYVRAPNVMLGYLKHANPGVLEPHDPTDWYDTGDIVDIDVDGFVFILGRAKRFAKLGGEMVSLVAAEAQVAQAWPDDEHAIVAVPDAKKGEALVLITTRAEPDVKALLMAGRALGIPELMLPRTIIRVDAIPLLGSGKTDYVTIQKIALAREVAEEG